MIFAAFFGLVGLLLVVLGHQRQVADRKAIVESAEELRALEQSLFKRTPLERFDELVASDQREAELVAWHERTIRMIPAESRPRLAMRGFPPRASLVPGWRRRASDQVDGLVIHGPWQKPLVSSSDWAQSRPHERADTPPDA